ncbi:Hypothetical predicted protein [Cloeon dipterum]|uniref:Secreted protein n=1 Tax=Cloeon dipterum TaxID=197152 RepID=A0A8S1CQJ5_9INSE|nr:Hypothetical predicted protein [Cloeon dipterum]
MHRQNAALGLLAVLLLLGIIHAAPACKTASRARYRPAIVPTTLPPTTQPTTTPLPQVTDKNPQHGLAMTSIIIAPNKTCPPGEERDHKGKCRKKVT